MNMQKIAPKLFAGAAVLGTVTTAVLAARATPKALKLIEESNANTFKEKAKACWKVYIPAGASCVITAATIISGFNDLMRKNTELAAAYGFGQTALRLYSERAPEVRQQVSAEMMRMQEPPSVDYIPMDTQADPKDQKNRCFDYLSGRYFHATTNEIKNAFAEFNETIAKVNGKGSLNQLYSCFHNPEELPNVGFADLLGWKYQGGETAVPMITTEPDKYGNPVVILDFCNPPNYDYSNEFA